MSLLNRLLKNKNRNASPEKTIATLHERDAAELYTLVVSSSDASVREEAVAKMPMGEELLKLATGEHSAKVKLLARRQVGVWLDKDLSLTDGLIKSLAGKHSELVNLVSCSNKAIDKVFASIPDEQALLEIAINGMTSSIRQHAAENIHGRTNLEALLSSVKSKDKSVTQIAKAKLDVFKQADAALAEKQQEAQSLCSSLEILQKRKLDDYFVQRFQELQAQWGGLSDEAKADSQARFREAGERCQQLLDEENQRLQAEQEAQAAIEQARHGVVLVQQKLASLLSEIYQAETLDAEAMQAQLAECATQLKDLQQHSPKLAEQCKRGYAIREAAESLLLEVEQSGSLPQLVQKLEAAEEGEGGEISRRISQLLRYKKHFQAERPAIVEQAAQAIQGWSQAKKEKLELESKLLKSIQELQRKANWAIDQGRLRQARGIYRELCEKREQHSHLPAGLVRRLEELDLAMDKLGDWYEFAVQPKKQALVEKMEGLVGCDISPNDLSDRIKELQDEWKALSKGGKSQDEELWQRFQTAGDKAFEPCRSYFDEQAREREQNAEKREEILSQLQTYYESYSWDSLVWKDVEQIINTAYDNWKSCWPVPRKDNKNLQQRFGSVMDKIQAKLGEAREVNHQAKGNLIKQAESLLEKSDTSNAIEEAKRLQSMWKDLGGTGGRGRNEDQKLWQQFRAACDQIFERRQQENRAVQDKFNSERERANNLQQKLDNILSQNGQAFLDARKTVADVQQEFLDLGELPEKEQGRVQGEFNKKIDQIDAKAKAIRDDQLQNSWDEVYHIAAELRAIEYSVLDGNGEPAAFEELKASIAENTSWPSGTQQLIEQRLRNAENQQIDTKENEKTLRLLCIKKEIALGKESPAEDKALRMEYQVAQLQQGFGNNAKASESAEKMALEWLAVPGLEESLYQSLLHRFKQ